MKLNIKTSVWGKGEREALNRLDMILTVNMYILMIVLVSIVFKWGVLIQYIGIGAIYFYDITAMMSANKWLKENKQNEQT